MTLVGNFNIMIIITHLFSNIAKHIPDMYGCRPIYNVDTT